MQRDRPYRYGTKKAALAGFEAFAEHETLILIL
jgi:hypothetical protein